VEHRVSMAAAGDHESLGLFPKWDMQYIQTGNKHAANAVRINALAALSYPINYRDSTTGVVPTMAQIDAAGVSRASGLPELPYGSGTATSVPYWEEEHPPAVGLVAFLTRPSPVFIEIAQKAGFFAHSWSRDDGVLTQWWADRSKAWGLRNLAHAAFLTPSVLPSGGSRSASEVTSFRSAAIDCLGRNVSALYASWIGSPKRSNPLHATWGATPYTAGNTTTDEAWDTNAGVGGFEVAQWMQYWLGGVLHRIDRSGLLTGHAQASNLASLTDWMLSMPVKVVNESTAGEWRYQEKLTTIGSNGHASSTTTDVGDPTVYANFGAAFLAAKGSPPSLSGTFYYAFGDIHSDYVTGWGAETDPGTMADSYSIMFVEALAHAVERGVTGAATAWSTVTSNVTNWDTWRTGLQTDPRAAHHPRTVGGSNYVNPDWPAWRRAMTPGTWTKVGTTMHATANAKYIAALNPAGYGGVSPWDDNEGFPALVNDWSGGAFDPSTNRLSVFGGGHVGYNGNEVISIDISAESPAWRFERPPAGWKGSASEGIDLDDGLESSKVYANGEPRSAHSYDMLAWADGSLYAIPAAVWKTSAEGVSAYKLFKFTPGANPDNTFSGGVAVEASYGTWSLVTAGLSAGNANSTSLTYDPVRNYLYHCRQSSMQRIDLDTGSVISAGAAVVVDADIRGIYIPGLDVVVYINYLPTGKFWVYNPATNTAHSPGAVGGDTNAPNPVAEPDKANTSIVAEYFTAAVWVPELGAVVVHAEGGSALSGFHLLTPPSSGSVLTTNWTWSRMEASAANAVTPDNRNVNGDYGRFFYSPQMKCLGYVSATSAAQGNNPLSSGQLNIFALP
jgi:hypothetical protein